MSNAEASGPVTDAEADGLFADLAAQPALVLAVSGGPDSTALMVLAARWCGRQDGRPRLTAVTIDHGLRPESRIEAAAVERLALDLGISHQTLQWSGPKPATGIQERARAARYELLHGVACRTGANCVLTGHTLDDQAETVLFRMLKGSGLSGLGGMARVVSLDAVLSGLSAGRHQPGANAIQLVRPLLAIEKARLTATLRAAGIAFVRDPSNDDPRFTRTRLRKLLPELSGEGLTARRLAHMARRVRRSEAAIEAVVAAATKRIGLSPETRRLSLDRAEFNGMPDEIALRLIGRVVGVVGDEGPVELGKLEALTAAITAAVAGGQNRFRRTLAGAMVSLQRDCIVIERAPSRRHRP